ncbi:MAG: hypothetical protein U0V48_17635 [Anaerolineales bacterium]
MRLIANGMTNSQIAEKLVIKAKHGKGSREQHSQQIAPCRPNASGGVCVAKGGLSTGSKWRENNDTQQKAARNFLRLFYTRQYSPPPPSRFIKPNPTNSRRNVAVSS